MAERKPAMPRKASPLKAVPSATPARPRVRRAPVQEALVEPPPPVTVRAAAEAGDERELLVRLRNRIATDIDNPDTPSRDLAALTRRIQEIAKDIKALDAREPKGGGDAGSGGATPDESFDASAI